MAKTPNDNIAIRGLNPVPEIDILISRVRAGEAVYNPTLKAVLQSIGDGGFVSVGGKIHVVEVFDDDGYDLFPVITPEDTDTDTDVGLFVGAQVIATARTFAHVGHKGTVTAYDPTAVMWLVEWEDHREEYCNRQDFEVVTP